jgi:hypothetical protein
MIPHDLRGRRVKVLAWDELRDVLPTCPSNTITHVADCGAGDEEVMVRIEDLEKNYYLRAERSRDPARTARGLLDRSADLIGVSSESVPPTARACQLPGGESSLLTDKRSRRAHFPSTPPRGRTRVAPLAMQALTQQSCYQPQGSGAGFRSRAERRNENHPEGPSEGRNGHETKAIS